MKELIKSPLNYTGGKYKLLPQILPLFPDNISTFVDLFCGGCNVAVNVKAKNIVCNDIEPHVIDLYKYFQSKSPNEIFDEIINKSNEYNLHLKIKDNYLSLRNDYNITKDEILFYLLITTSFSNQIRFSKQGNFNVSFGDRYFNSSMQTNLKEFLNILHTINIKFYNNDFKQLNINNLSNNDFVYCDPPYLITCANYNEQDGWNEGKDEDLMLLLDEVNSKNIKFAMSNVLYHKGKTNDGLIEWCKKYNIHHLNYTYSNCSYHGNRGSSDEVLICNY